MRATPTTVTDFSQLLDRMKDFCSQDGMDASTDLILRLMETSSQKLTEDNQNKTDCIDNYVFWGLCNRPFKKVDVNCVINM